MGDPTSATGAGAKPARPRFAAGANIAVKIPRFRYEATVAFYRDVLGLPDLGEQEGPTGPSHSFAFGPFRLWLDRIDHQGQTDVWLELATDDPDAATAYLGKAGVPIRDEIEPLGPGEGHWISDPAGVVFHVAPAGEGYVDS